MDLCRLSEKFSKFMSLFFLPHESLCATTDRYSHSVLFCETVLTIFSSLFFYANWLCFGL